MRPSHTLHTLPSAWNLLLSFKAQLIGPFSRNTLPHPPGFSPLRDGTRPHYFVVGIQWLCDLGKLLHPSPTASSKWRYLTVPSSWGCLRIRGDVVYKSSWLSKRWFPAPPAVLPIWRSLEEPWDGGVGASGTGQILLCPGQQGVSPLEREARAGQWDPVIWGDRLPSP